MQGKFSKKSHFVLAWLLYSLVWIPGAAAWAQSSSQVIFQPYVKPVRAQTFSLENLQEKIVDIQDYRDKVILLNFWATW